MAGNHRQGRDYTRRKKPHLRPKQSFLILCEGEQTEPNYFQHFRCPLVKVTPLGLGIDPMRLVNRAIREREDDPDTYDQIWCVFDRDEVPPERFNQAIALARQKQKKHIFVAYANPAFELWLLLHFHYCDVPLDRQECNTRLGHALGRAYDKTDPKLYLLVKNRLPMAIEHARKLEALYEPKSSPADHNPATNIHLLVEQLLRYTQR